MLMGSDPSLEAYQYDPTLAGCFVFAILFGVMTFFHSIMTPENKTLYFIPLLIGGICTYSLASSQNFPQNIQGYFSAKQLICNLIVETIRYDARAASDKQSPSMTSKPHLQQSFLQLGTPALFAGTICMMLGRFMVSVDGVSITLVGNGWVKKVSVTSDVISLFMQLTGTYPQTREQTFTRKALIS